MAFSNTQLGLIMRSAQAMARADGSKADVDDIARRLQGKFDPSSEQPFEQLRIAARSAIKTRSNARAVEEAGDSAIPANQYSIWVGIDPGDARYRYRVVVSSTNPDTMDQFETAFDIESSRSLSFSRIAELARERFAENQLERDYTARVKGAGSHPVLEVFVVDAGRKA